MAWSYFVHFKSFIEQVFFQLQDKDRLTCISRVDRIHQFFLFYQKVVAYGRRSNNTHASVCLHGIYYYQTKIVTVSWLFFLGCKCCQWSPAFCWNVFWKIHQNEKVSSTHHSSRFFGPICHQQNLAQDKCWTTISLWTQCV